jgi:hypothetical protein
MTRGSTLLTQWLRPEPYGPLTGGTGRAVASVLGSEAQLDRSIRDCSAATRPFKSARSRSRISRRPRSSAIAASIRRRPCVMAVMLLLEALEPPVDPVEVPEHLVS